MNFIKSRIKGVYLFLAVFSLFTLSCFFVYQKFFENNEEVEIVNILQIFNELADEELPTKAKKDLQKKVLACFENKAKVKFNINGLIMKEQTIDKFLIYLLANRKLIKEIKILSIFPEKLKKDEKYTEITIKECR